MLEEINGFVSDNVVEISVGGQMHGFDLLDEGRNIFALRFFETAQEQVLYFSVPLCSTLKTFKNTLPVFVFVFYQKVVTSIYNAELQVIFLS